MRGWVGLGRKHPPSQSRSPKECSQARRLLDTGFNPFTPALNFGPFSDVVLPFESGRNPMVTIQMKPLMQFRPFLYFSFSKTFESVDEILWFDR